MSSIYNWGVQKIWGGDEDRDAKREVNSAVAHASETVRDMEVKQKHLIKKMTRLQQEALEAQDNEDEITMSAKAQEWELCKDQLETLNSVLQNTKITNSVLDKAATNVNAFSIQQDASKALQQVTSQVKLQDVERVASTLEADIGTANDLSSAMSRPLKYKVSSRHQQKSKNVDNIMSSWSTTKMPKVPTSTTQRVPIQKQKEEEDGLK